MPRYLDNEVSDAEARNIHAHLLTCTACAAELATLVRLKLALRSAHLRFEPSPALRRKVLMQIRPPRRMTWRRIWFPAIPAAFAVLLLGLAIRYWPATNRNMFGEITDLHVATLASANPVDVVSSDKHTVKPWFEGRIPFAFELPELKGTDFTLLGGRVAYLHQAPAAQLIYGAGLHRISVFVFQDRPELQLDMLKHAVGAIDYTYVFYSSSEEGLHFVLVGSVDSKKVQRLGQLIFEANKR
ncbi:MAG: anti-sigma factor [Acidobacteriales bacterium]|nr:anti-sigma factor [Terriglobales bacterium]